MLTDAGIAMRLESGFLNPIDDEEIVWLALSHLKLPPDAFAAALAEPLLDDKTPFCALVRCNPLLQLRSLLVDREMTEDFAAEYRSSSCLALREGLADHVVEITAQGRVVCDIYTKKRFYTDAVWTHLRGLAAAALAEAGLPDWHPIPDRWSYRRYATWDEFEDELHAALVRGERLADLPQLRRDDPASWAPRRRS